MLFFKKLWNLFFFLFIIFTNINKALHRRTSMRICLLWSCTFFLHYLVINHWIWWYLFILIIFWLHKLWNIDIMLIMSSCLYIMNISIFKIFHISCCDGLWFGILLIDYCLLLTTTVLTYLHILLYIVRHSFRLWHILKWCFNFGIF